jgi:hypothetical protein
VLVAADSVPPRLEGVEVAGFYALPSGGAAVTSHSPVVVGKQGSFEKVPVTVIGCATPDVPHAKLGVVPA